MQGSEDLRITSYNVCYTKLLRFNSFRDPCIILFGSVPLAMFGALLFTFLKMPNPNMHYWTSGWTTTLNIYAQVGMVTLVGLIAKNSYNFV